jgi:hypothetical protein
MGAGFGFPSLVVRVNSPCGLVGKGGGEGIAGDTGSGCGKRKMALGERLNLN